MIRRSNPKTLAKIAAWLVALVIISSGVLTLLYINDGYQQNKLERMMKNQSSVTLASYKSTSSLALASIIGDEEVDLNYVILDEKDLLSEFDKNEKDIIIAPIDKGCKKLDAGSNYKLLAVMNWGNVNILSSNGYGNDMLAVVDDIDRAVIDSLYKDSDELKNPNYVSYSKATEQFDSNGYTQIALNEPYYSSFYEKVKDDDYNKISLNDIYKAKNNYSRYPKDAIFIKNDTIEANSKNIVTVVNKMKTAMTSITEETIKKANDSGLVDLDILGIDEKLWSNSFNKSGVDIEYANSCVDEINSLLKIFGLKLNDNEYIK